MRRLSMVFVALAFTAATNPALAQPYAVPPTWGGDFWSRPRLTGDWGGLRDELGQKGVVLDLDVLATPMGVLSGGRSTGWETWGNADYTLNVDTQKLGLWPGGFINLQGDTGVGNSLQNAGALVPVNIATLIPGLNDNTTVLMNATVMQFLSTKFGVVMGKFNTAVGDEQEFFGDYTTQFLNTAFVFPMTLAQIPISAFGGGVIALPAPNVTLSLLALDPNGTPASNNVGKAFDDGVMVVGNGHIAIQPYGLVGHQNFGFSWSNKSRYSLDQDPTNIATLLLQEKYPLLGNPGPILEQILARFFPGLLVPAQPANRKDTTWSFNYGFDQYFWQPDGDSKRGVGVFFSFGASDGNPNPVKYAFLAGLGGKGVVPGRPDDTFGIGLARTQLSSAFVPFLREHLNLGLEHEDSFEMYYNFAVTGWLAVTGDLQVINQALNKQLSPAGPGLTNVDNATVAGIRARARF